MKFSPLSLSLLSSPFLHSSILAPVLCFVFLLCLLAGRRFCSLGWERFSNPSVTPTFIQRYEEAVLDLSWLPIWCHGRQLWQVYFISFIGEWGCQFYFKKFKIWILSETFYFDFFFVRIQVLMWKFWIRNPKQWNRIHDLDSIYIPNHEVISSEITNLVIVTFEILWQIVTN